MREQREISIGKTRGDEEGSRRACPQPPFDEGPPWKKLSGTTLHWIPFLARVVQYSSAAGRGTITTVTVPMPLGSASPCFQHSRVRICAFCLEMSGTDCTKMSV